VAGEPSEELQGVGGLRAGGGPGGLVGVVGDGAASGSREQGAGSSCVRYRTAPRSQLTAP
jgi:hypothetical protein